MRVPVENAARPLPRCREIARRAGFGFFRVLNYEELRDLIDVPHTRIVLSPRAAGPMNLSKRILSLWGPGIREYTGPQYASARPPRSGRPG